MQCANWTVMCIGRIVSQSTAYGTALFQSQAKQSGFECPFPIEIEFNVFLASSGMIKPD